MHSDSHYHHNQRAFTAEAITYVQSHQHSIIPALQADISLGGVGSMKSKEGGDEYVRTWDTIFDECVKALIEDQPSDPLINKSTDFKIRAQKSWAEVWKALSSAFNAYTTEQTVLKTWRGHSGIVAKRLSRAAEMIPDGLLTFPLRATIKFIDDCIIATSDLRETFKKNEMSIDAEFELAGRYLHIFRNSNVVRKRAIDLGAAVLKCLEYTIDFLLSSHISRAIDVIWNIADYRPELKKSVEEVGRCAKTLKDFVTVKQLQSIEYIADRQRHAQTAINYIIELLEQGHPISSLADKTITRKTSFPTTQGSLVAKECCGISEIIDALDMAGPLLYDFRRILYEVYSTTMPDKEVSRTFGLIRSSRLGSWLKSPKSAVLLVIDTELDTPGFVSAISYVCTTLVVAIESVKAQTSLSFFCGMQDIRGLKESYVAFIMIQSLLEQLIASIPQGTDVSIPTASLDRDSIKRLDIISLCDVFCKILRGFPHNFTIVCIIDSISLYQYMFEMRELKYLLECLVALTSDDISPTFKLLLTSPVPTAYFQQAFPEDMTIFIERLAHEGDESEALDRIN